LIETLFFLIIFYLLVYFDEQADREEHNEVEAMEINNATETKSRKDRPAGSIHFGDTDFDVDEQAGAASWGEVCHACCVHSGQEWAMIALGIFLVCFFLYFFLVGLDLLGNGARVMTGCTAGELFGDDTNPIAGLMIGILATVLLQSSSTTTSIVVSLVGSAVSVRQGIYMIMGANIGTSVTNTIVAMGQMGDGDQLERAFAGATVHDMFNFLSVAVLLPVEVITGYLYRLTKAIVKDANLEDGESWDGPISKLVDPLSEKIIIPNSSITRAIALGDATCNDGGGFYPMNCTEDTYLGCGGAFGLIACSSDSGKCPAFFQGDASARDDKVSGGVVFFIAIVVLFVCLAGLVTVLQKLLLGMSTRVVYKATDINGYLAIAIGTGLTMLVQSSSITTSTLTPLVGIGALRLEQMLPLTLGANIGTTLTAILSALVSASKDSLQVALAHLFFNLTGILIWYPVPFMRRVPLGAARRLGKLTRIWRGFPILYIGVMFFLIPLLLLGLSSLFDDGSTGFTVLGSFLTILLFLTILYAVYWFRYRDGRQKCSNSMAQREKNRVVMKELPDDMVYLKEHIKRLIEHTGLPEDEDVPAKYESPDTSDAEVDT
jgi:sodium-dependent phosphate cotransporter